MWSLRLFLKVISQPRGAHVWVDLRVTDMMQRARERWATLSAEDRAVLAYAYRDAFHSPQRVGDYKLELRKMRESNKYMQIHTFRFGYANFILINVEEGTFIYDLWLDSDIAIAAE
jgi:histidinol-phosphate/aromatic aminotransferase/cobyric acid decarboxylase-like protein